MKSKIIKVIPIFIFIAIPISFLIYTFAYDHLLEKNREVSLSYINKLLIEPEENYDINNRNKILENLSNIDSNIYKKMLEDNIEIRLINSSFKDDKDIMTLLEPSINVSNDDEMNYNNNNISIDKFAGLYIYDNFLAIRIDINTYGAELHEVGHYVDYALNEISMQDELREIMKKEKDKVIRYDKEYEEYWNNPKEYFAEIFEVYNSGEIEKKRLKKDAPKSYTYIEKVSTTFTR